MRISDWSSDVCSSDLLEHDWRLVGNVANKLYFLTNKGAPQLRLVTLDAERPNAPPVEIVPERAETLDGGSMVGDQIILAYLQDAQTVAGRVHLDGQIGRAAWWERGSQRV